MFPNGTCTRDPCGRLQSRHAASRAVSVPRAGDSGLAEAVLLNLLVRRLRQRVDELDVARDHEVRHAPLAPGDERLRSQRLSRAQHDDDLHLVLAELGRHPDGSGLEHRRMVVHDLLDLVRRDVLAAPPHRVLLAVDEVQIAVLVEGAEVAGVEPQVAPGLERGVGVPVVAEHHRVRLVAAVDDLADLPRRERGVPVVHLGVTGHHTIALEGRAAGIASGAVGEHGADRRPDGGRVSRDHDRPSTGSPRGTRGR